MKWNLTAARTGDWYLHSANSRGVKLQCCNVYDDLDHALETFKQAVASMAEVMPPTIITGISIHLEYEADT
jgi:hypothetical protein